MRLCAAVCSDHPDPIVIWLPMMGTDPGGWQQWRRVVVTAGFGDRVLRETE